MINEALCKILCHNICCLIQSHYELSVNAAFWGKETQVIETRKTDEDRIDALAWV
jgi:hypothetical protein